MLMHCPFGCHVCIPMGCRHSLMFLLDANFRHRTGQLQNRRSSLDSREFCMSIYSICPEGIVQYITVDMSHHQRILFRDYFNCSKNKRSVITHESSTPFVANSALFFCINGRMCNPAYYIYAGALVQLVFISHAFRYNQHRPMICQLQ